MAESRELARSERTKSLLAYVVMLLGTGLVFELVTRAGASLEARAPTSDAVFAGAVIAQHEQPLLHVLFALVVIALCGRLLGTLLGWLGQPPVIGEVAAGLMLGPSCLGALWPSAYAFVLPASIGPMLGVISQLGVILYMFAVGLSLDTSVLGGRERAVIAISHASIAVPFSFGALLALLLYPRVSTADVPFAVFAAFVGVSMSVTAFPVLARILTDRGAQKTRLGAIALACAAAGDMTAWCLLALVVSFAHAAMSHAALTLALAVTYAGVMVLLVRPRVARVLALTQGASVPSRHVALALLALLCSALVTEALGVHAVFGAFLLGVVLPSDAPLAATLRAKIEDVVAVLFLPAFFAFTGMRTQLATLATVEHWALCLLIIAVASVGKIGGSAAAARVSGLSWVDATALGVLMNTRGLMELIVLNIGLDLRILSPALFAMFVLMALVTTVATAPLLDLVRRVART